MRKVYLLNVFFLIAEVISFIPLTIEIFGDMNPDIIIIPASVFGVGILGSCICTIARVVHRYGIK